LRRSSPACVNKASDKFTGLDDACARVANFVRSSALQNEPDLLSVGMRFLLKGLNGWAGCASLQKVESEEEGSRVTRKGLC
jgi:hypothetical protein